MYYIYVQRSAGQNVGFSICYLEPEPPFRRMPELPQSMLVVGVSTFEFLIFNHLLK